MQTLEVARFRIQLVAPRGRVSISAPPDWNALPELPWVYPESSACCGRAAEELFKVNRVRPKRIISVDREAVTRTLIAAGVGVGLLHDGTAKDAEAREEIDVLLPLPASIRVMFAYQARRAQEPLLVEAASLMRAAVATPVQ